jgi:D-hexose-6-phosphate mutarotase
MVTVQEGSGGLPFVQIRNRAAQAKICLLGATVMEYQPEGAQPVLWVSPNSVYQAGESIRAGIPVCWPWFGQHPSAAPGLPGHGFIRTGLWTVITTEENSPDLTTVVLGTDDSQISHPIFPNRYSLRLRVQVGKELRVTLATTNRGENDFQFSAALHTYFQISDIANIKIDGLDNVPFLDKVRKFAQFAEPGPIQIAGQVDRVYINTESTCVIDDPAWQRQIVIEKEGSRTTVVWNPWATLSAAAPDLGPDAYRHYVCVETVLGPQENKILPAGETHELTTIIRLEELK